MSEVRQYALNTSIEVEMPFSTFVAAHVMCSDGRVRKTYWIAQTADTFFSVPCAVMISVGRVNGKSATKSISGYFTVETANGSSVDTIGDPMVVKFNAYTYRKNGYLLPSGLWRLDPRVRR